MRVINWLDFKPLDTDIEALAYAPGQSVHVRLLARQMVRSCLSAYPWQGRTDLVVLFDASVNYQEGQAVALPVVDKQGVRPDTWRCGVVKSVQVGENTAQGKFQVVQIIVNGREHWLAAAVDGAKPLSYRFPPDEDEFDFLADDFVNQYLPQFNKVIDSLIDNGKLRALRQDDQVVFGNAEKITADFDPWFANPPVNQQFLTLDDLILNLWEIGELTETPEALARALVEQTLLERNYVDAGGGRWMPPEKLAELDRQISRRLEVPRNRSKVKAQYGDMEELDAEDYADLPEQGQVLLQDLNVEIEELPPAEDRAWTPPTGPLKMPPLSYLNIMQGYFPLNETLLQAFAPCKVAGLVDVQLVEWDELPFVVNLQEATLKSFDPQALYQRFVTELGIPAGTFLWLEYRGKNQYRIAPRPLAVPKPVQCKQAWLEQDGSLQVEDVEIAMRFEGDEHLFKAELRFEDMKALFREAEERDFSIFDAIYDVLPKLAILRTDGLVHYRDIFNAVFFEYRMCSYHTVIHELYDHVCFIAVGDGLFRFAPELGVSRRRPTRQQVAAEFWQPQPAVSEKRSPNWNVESVFWQQIATEIPRKLQTLDEQRPFEITSVTHEAIELVVSTGNVRSIPRAEVERAWNELNQRGWLDRERVAEFANFNVAYVMAILAQLSGVSYKLRPLRLTYKLPDENLILQQQEISASIDVEFHTEEHKKDNKRESEKFIPVERTRLGQLIAPDLLPSAPLFASQNSNENAVQYVTAGTLPTDDFSETILPGQGELMMDAPIVTDLVNGISKDKIPEETYMEVFSMESKEALNALISQLTQELQLAQANGTKAFQHGNFSEAQSAAKRGEELAEQIRNLKALHQKWNTLVPNPARRESTPLAVARRPRAARREKTAEPAFYLPILLVLREMGGKGRTKDVVDRVGEILKSKFTEADLEFLENAREARWRNTAHWARNDMVNAGLLASGSPHGVWEITPKGLEYIDKNQEPE